MILGILYRQPTNPQHKSDAPEFMKLVTSIVSKIEAFGRCTLELYICGDFNIAHTLSKNLN